MNLPPVRQHLRSSSTAVVTFVMFVTLLAAARASAQQVPLPDFAPWFYTDDGRMAWDRHQWVEDTANTEFVIAEHFLDLAPAHQQPGAWPDALFFNSAHFDPPDGVPTAPGQKRRLLRESVELRGLQLFVNYSDALVSTSHPQRYVHPSFFLSLDAPNLNDQPVLGSLPPVPSSGLSSVRVSAVGGATGTIGIPVPVRDVVQPFHRRPDPAPYAINALYVAANVGYAPSEFHQDDQTLLAEVTRNRLFQRQSNGTWLDVSNKLPAAAQVGPSSSACFADFNGDGFHDLYIGRPGDNYNGARNFLLLFDPGTQAYLDRSGPPNVPSFPNDSTADVEAADIDADGDPDIVVGNRFPRNGPVQFEWVDYALINDGNALFSFMPLVNFANPIPTDTRSVAVGEFDPASPGREIVLGNAGSDGYSNLTVDQLVFVLPPPPPLEMFKNTTQVFRNQAALPALDYVDETFTASPPRTKFLNPVEEYYQTSPFTRQVVVADLFGWNANGAAVNQPDGLDDLVVVAHRDTLVHWRPNPGSNGQPMNGLVAVFVQSPTPAGIGRHLPHFASEHHKWARAIALANFAESGADAGNAPPDTLDVLIGAGNRFSGADSHLLENIGANGPPRSPWNKDDLHQALLSYDCFPGSERGYGFDFADVDKDGDIDALQTSRMYDYFIKGMLTYDVASGPDKHVNLTTPGPAGTGSPVSIRNERGWAKPQGMEDGVFADFDGDGRLDALMASQRFASYSIHGGRAASNNLRADVMFLMQSGTFTWTHDEQTVNVVPPGPTVKEDSLVNIGSRNVSLQPNLADRAVAGDLDNDGDIDAIVQLFEISPPPNTGLPTIPTLSQLAALPGYNFPPARFSAGWRYLRNDTQPGTVLFTDIADTNMRDSSGQFSPLFNRGLGMSVLADLDNNGALDLYTTVGLPQTLVTPGPNPGPNRVGVGSMAQTHDLLFANAFGGAPIGVLTEVSSQVLPPPAPHVTAGPTRSPGSFGVAAGDIDNDGDTDVIVTRGQRGELTGFPGLFVNQLFTGTGTGPFSFLDQYTSRVPVVPSQLSQRIHSRAHPTTPGQTMDAGHFPALFDFDGDGDLDLVIQVIDNLPRFYRNRGFDANGDGLITVADGTPLGNFEDVTDAMVDRVRPCTDGQDMQAIDVDFDGDFDLAVNPYADELFLWENRSEELLDADVVVPVIPKVTDIWPRTGSRRGTVLELTGAGLAGVDLVEFRFATGVALQTMVTQVNDHKISAVLPSGNLVGLAQVRVRRAGVFSRQYIGYFVL